MTAPWRVFLVDDHALVRRGLAALLATDGRFLVVGEASDGAEALERLATTAADVVVLDLSMPRLNGLDTLRALAAQDRAPPVVLLSMYGEERFVAQAFELGARAYVLKQSLDHELFKALETVRRGLTYASPAVEAARVRTAPAGADALTAREREVLALIAEGCTTPVVAARLGISPHTATRHRANLMQKLGAHNQVALLRRARELGLVMLDG
ncbi:MAG: response regulator transcription factor [Gemmatimonadales bacterium]|nr:response regulator transcription factor [Gemmatimonadales bacterium]